MSDISRRLAGLSPEQRALLERRLKASAAPTTAREPIAIIGMGCRFPGADSPEAFWGLLRDGVDAIREVPGDRWDVDALFDPDPSAPGKIAARVGGFVDDVDRFDAAFFEISPREAVRMDPQQRLLLEVACDALEEGGQTRERLAGSATGVFVGVHSHASDYLWLQYLEPEDMDAFTGTGTAHNLLAGRLSYLFDLHGPAVVVDTACSSSLVATHLAIQSLRSRESDLAVAAGVNLILTPHFTIAASRMHMLAPDGRCKAFDQRADGFVRGEGCGAVVLKRLSDALRDGDPVVAVIRGSATNQDGHTNGITAPNGLAQRAAVESALRDGGVAPEDVGYVEAHGTGTALGDPIEIEALSASVGRPRADGVPCVVGSVKTNVGHLEGGAGVAGLMKAALILKHGEIPPNLHFTGLNPHINVAGTRFEFPTKLRPWPAGGRRRLAGVSAFGWSGTNAHMVLEEAPEAAARPAPGEAGWLFLPISARSHAALGALARSYRDRLAAADGGEASDVCFTAALRRSHHDHRVAFVGRSAGDLVSGLDGALAAGITARRSETTPRVVFVFPGQGSQWLGMGQKLLGEEPAFKEAIARCDAAIQAEAGWSLVAELEASPEASRLHEIDVVQPTLFAVEVALAELWRAWGIVPEAVVGHSMGEVAAAHVAGVLSLPDAARIICRRSRLLRRIAGRGAMAVVELSVEEAKEALAGVEDRLSIAVSNGPRSTVISGDPAALQKVLETLSRREVFCRPVKVDVASHSPQVDELRSALLGELAGLAPGPAAVPIYSTVTASVRPGEGFDAEYWVRNLREPVRFFDALRGLLGDGHDAFVEMSPHPILLPAVDDAIAHEQKEAITLPSLRREEDEEGVMRASAASLYAWGANLDWKRFVPSGAASVALPRYPWQRERFWLEGTGGEDAARPALRGSPEHPLLGVRVEAADRPEVWLWESVWSPNAPACRYAHELQGLQVFAAAGFVDLALTAAAVASGAPADALLSLELLEPLRLPQGGERLRVQVVLSRAEESPLLQVFSRVLGRWVRHARAKLGSVAATAASSLEETRKRCPAAMTGEAYYARLAEVGVGVREELLGLGRLWAGERELVAECRASSGTTAVLGASVPASLLDAAFQLAAVSPRSIASPQSGLDLHMPMRVEGARLGRIKDARWIVVSSPEGGQPGGDAVRRQVVFFDTEGRELGAIGGVELRRLEVAVAGSDPSAWAQRLEWKASPRPGQPATAGGAEGRWVVLSDQGGVGDSLAAALEAKGGTPVVVTASDACGRHAPHRWRVRPGHGEDLASVFQALGDEGAPLRGVVHLWSLDAEKGDGLSEADLLAAQELGCESLVLLLQELARRSLVPPPRVFGVTSGVQKVGAGEDPSIAAAPLWGLGRVAAEEHPELWGGMIDLDPAAAVGDSARLLVEEITAPSEESDVALRRGARHVLRLAPLSEAIASRPVAFRPDASYLVTGGLGGLGLEVARWMAAQGARHLVLVGRTGLPPRERWGAELPERLREAASVVTEIERGGVEVRVASVDVGDAASVGGLLDVLRRAGAPPLRGVVHTAGTIDDRLIADLDRESLHRVLRPKLLGGFVLERALAGEALDFFVLFSSLGSLLGPPGQGSYAAANAFLDALAQHRRARGSPVLSVNWGAWAGRGFAATEGGARTAEALEAQGISSFSPSAALELLGRLMAGAPAQVAVLPLDPAKFLASGRRVPPLLADLVRAPHSGPAPSTAAVRRQILDIPAGERGAFLEAHLQEQVAAVLKLPPSKIEPHRPLGSLGLESLTALELRKRLEATLGLRLSATLVWSYPTVTALAQHLATRLSADTAAPQPQAPRPAAAAPAGAALSAVERLSEEEALRELLGGKGKGA
jgi:myxalamid-type polyketide synthase MxaE and MxaD